MAKNNPNGANQYKVDPRQALFLKGYLDVKSETFANALQSALAAGYAPEYSENLVGQMPTWLSVKLGELNKDHMMNKVRKNLDDFLDDKDTRLKFDATKFVGETIGKAIYSKRTELTGADGKDLIPIGEEKQKEIDNAIDLMLDDS